MADMKKELFSRLCKVYQHNLHQWASDESLRPAAERKERVRLEAESNSLLTRAFSAPSAALSELRALKAENYSLKRDKGAAEVREAELRRELLQLGRTVRLQRRDSRRRDCGQQLPARARSLRSSLGASGMEGLCCLGQTASAYLNSCRRGLRLCHGSANALHLHMLGLPRLVPVELRTGTAALKGSSDGARPEELLRLQRALTAAQKDLARCRIDLEAANAKLEIFRWTAHAVAADKTLNAASLKVPIQARCLQSPPTGWASAE